MNLSLLTNNKTILTAVMGILVAVMGVVFGPIDIAGTQIPALSVGDAVTIIWNALMVIFLRMGVTKSGPAQ